MFYLALVKSLDKLGLLRKSSKCCDIVNHIGHWCNVIYYHKMYLMNNQRNKNIYTTLYESRA